VVTTRWGFFNRRSGMFWSIERASREADRAGRVNKLEERVAELEKELAPRLAVEDGLASLWVFSNDSVTSYGNQTPRQRIEALEKNERKTSSRIDRLLRHLGLTEQHDEAKTTIVKRRKR
jgi:polyhydroxyalkanoate synthesis regulator phasin